MRSANARMRRTNAFMSKKTNERLKRAIHAVGERMNATNNAFMGRKSNECPKKWQSYVEEWNECERSVCANRSSRVGRSAKRSQLVALWHQRVRDHIEFTLHQLGRDDDSMMSGQSAGTRWTIRATPASWLPSGRCPRGPTSLTCSSADDRRTLAA
jgi:hypothetical protein